MDNGNGKQKPVRLQFTLPTARYRFEPKSDITGLETAESTAFLIMLAMFQMAVASGAPAPALMKLDHNVGVGWKRMPETVQRHFEREEAPQVSAVQKPGLILPKR